MKGSYTAVARAAVTLPVAVIVNPGSGDLASPCPPNADWAAIISLFAAHPNVSTLGYVHSSYGKRPSADFAAEIDASFRCWKAGIFVDEAV